MQERKPPKSIATINFKGGVGKTTITWCLGDLISTLGKVSTILFDLDAQMSLTQAITLNVDGTVFDKFGSWSRASYKAKKTIYNAIEAYTLSNNFEFRVDKDFAYRIHENYDFVPAVEELYWLELDMVNKAQMQAFMRDLLAKMAWSTVLPRYDYALFDCPPESVRNFVCEAYHVV